MAGAVTIVYLGLSAILILLASSASADNECDSFWCFSIFSKRVKVNFNLFRDSKPLPIEDLIRQSGYPLERHEIKTEDGYLLTYHRIPRGKDSNVIVDKPAPVLLQHGLLGASACWVLSEHSLAFTLADAGFDVWLGNARGNTYSRKHTKLDPDEDKKAFWDFSWHEMGYYDLPAGIDYILDKTGKKQLYYIGHSMGTTMYFVLGATRPEYMDKVQAGIMLAPVAFPWNIRSPLANFLNRFNTAINLVAKTFGVYEVFPYSDGMFWLDQNVCSKSMFQFICRDVLYYMGGFGNKELNRTSLTTVLEYMPAGAAYKQLRHYRQISKEGANFQQFDYGFLKNYWIYNSSEPPLYDLTNVRSPLYMYYAMNDWLAVPEDALHVAEHLPNVQRITKVPDDQFNHLDFMWAIDAKTLLYDDIIGTLQNLTITT